MHIELAALDFAIIGLYLTFALAVGTWFTRRASSGVESFFVGERKFPWWVAGTSIVATTFAADTPLAVTGIVAVDGIAGNWIWWSWAIAHLTATFFFARMWRRSGVITDAEITELRYSGKMASRLRAFKAVYFGVFINCLTMAWVIAAMVKISQSFFDVAPALVITVCVAASVAYTTLGGFRSVVVTDMVQFGLGMMGAILLAVYAVSYFDGIGAVPSESAQRGSGMLGALSSTLSVHGEQALSDVLDFVPRSDHPTLPLVYLIVLLIAGWWRYAEGNGYIVQRLASCKDEGHAMGASLWFAMAHNALRPWPWILVALASLCMYPKLPGTAPSSIELRAADETVVGQVSPATLDLAQATTLRIEGVRAGCVALVLGQQVPLRAVSANDFEAVFPRMQETTRTDLTVHCGDEVFVARGIRVELQDREMGYPLMMGQMLPVGLLGLVIASLLAAFMSTIDTHTNWGASYLVQDVYRRFLRPDADERHYVWVCRVAIIGMAILAGVTALFISNIASVWRFLIALGAGLGSVSAARWYWWRVTPHAEFAALGVTTVLAIAFELVGAPMWLGIDNPFPLITIPAWAKIVIIAIASLATWIPVALFGPANDDDTLRAFADRVRPPGPGFIRYRSAHTAPLWPDVLRFGGGLLAVFGTLFGIGQLLLGSVSLGITLLLVAMGSLLSVVRSASTTIIPPP